MYPLYGHFLPLEYRREEEEKNNALLQVVDIIIFSRYFFL
jgi:hypothetical protein